MLEEEGEERKRCGAVVQGGETSDEGIGGAVVEHVALQPHPRSPRLSQLRALRR
jgi:hypothetical protein